MVIKYRVEGNGTSNKYQKFKEEFRRQGGIKGYNLDIYKGEIIGYIGPNGAGKSTTVLS